MSARGKHAFDLHAAILTDKLPVNSTMSQAISFPLQAPTLFLHPASILEVALSEYKKYTGQDLLSHPLSVELQHCDSVDGVLSILQRQADTLKRRRDGDRGLMKWVSSSVHILYSISATLGDGAGLVSLRNEIVAVDGLF